MRLTAMPAEVAPMHCSLVDFGCLPLISTSSLAEGRQNGTRCKLKLPLTLPFGVSSEGYVHHTEPVRHSTSGWDTYTQPQAVGCNEDQCDIM